MQYKPLLTFLLFVCDTSLPKPYGLDADSSFAIWAEGPRQVGELRQRMFVFPWAACDARRRVQGLGTVRGKPLPWTVTLM